MWGEREGSGKAEFWKAIDNFPPNSTPRPPFSEPQIGDGFTVLQHRGCRNEGRDESRRPWWGNCKPCHGVWDLPCRPKDSEYFLLPIPSPNILMTSPNTCICKLSTWTASLMFYAHYKHRLNNLEMNEIRTSYKYKFQHFTSCPQRLSCMFSGLLHPTLETSCCKLRETFPRGN